MKWLTFSALATLISLVGSTLAQAQDDLPALDLPTASSATALNGLQARQLSTDFDFLFLPAGAGGEQSTAEWSYPAVELDPVSKTITNQVDHKALPAHSIVEPNRGITTQTDPSRLTVFAPALPPAN